MTEWCELEAMHVTAYCLHESVVVWMSDGSKKSVRGLSVGDEVMTLDSDGTITTGTIAACVRYRKRTDAEGGENEVRPFEFVRLGSTIVTKGHPVRVGNASVKNWRRPEEVSGAMQFTQLAQEVYNFVVAGRTSLLVNDGLEVATLGQFCAGVDREDSYFGTERVVRYLETQESWPNVILWDA